MKSALCNDSKHAACNQSMTGCSCLCHWHQTISFVKSGIRIVGYALIPFDLLLAAGVLILSELVGVVEEVGHE